MIHVYWGDGKGKTTAAMGLALRCAGRGRRVVIAQFLKGGDTGERLALKSVPNVTLLPVPEKQKFLWEMSDGERQVAAKQCGMLLEQADEALSAGCGLLVLDEICAAVRTGLTPADSASALLDRVPAETDVVLTGRDPLPEWLRRADYSTELRALRHPYERGIAAREGIEY